MSNSVVIVGAGQAAAQLAMSLRQGGFADPITVIGDEPHLPYQRPPLSKKFLTERKPPETLFLRPAAHWRDLDVTLELGRPVAALDRGARRFVMADGREVSFDTLVLATGTSARVPPIPGIALAGVYSLRRIADVQTLRPALDEARRVIIIGGGYIGLEVAAIVRGEGRDVTVLEAQDRVLKRVTGPVTSDFFDRFHRERGVDVRLGVQIVAIEGEGRVTAVRLAPDEVLPADIVLVATGARANDALAGKAGIACADGILVDAATCTDTPGILAIGDCTRFPSARYGRQIRLESVQNAIDQAKAAAATILGKPPVYDPVPWFWSDQYEIKLQIAGIAEDFDGAETVGNPATARFSVEYRRGGRLIAVDAINDGRAHMLARKRISDQSSVISDQKK